MTDVNDELFGSCRSLVQRGALDVQERAELWALLKQARALDTTRYEEVWLPYLANFPHHWQRPLVKLDDVHSLPEARQIAPFARCTMSLEAMHRWLLKEEADVSTATGIELSREIEDQEDSVALWMDAVDPSWRETQDRFETFGITPTGSMLSVWYRPSMDELEEPSVVLFGDEGELVGLAPSLHNFVYLMAYTFDPFNPSQLVYELRSDAAARDRFQESFSRKVEAIFGQVPSHEALIAPLEALTAEFEAWVDQFE